MIWQPARRPLYATCVALQERMFFTPPCCCRPQRWCGRSRSGEVKPVQAGEPLQWCVFAPLCRPTRLYRDGGFSRRRDMSRVRSVVMKLRFARRYTRPYHFARGKKMMLVLRRPGQHTPGVATRPRSAEARYMFAMLCFMRRHEAASASRCRFSAA